jgi:hypothetical protein
MFGRFSIYRVGMAIRPTSTIRMLQTVVRTGRLMKLSENDIGVQLAAGAGAGARRTGMPERSRAVLLTTTSSPLVRPESTG